VSAASARKGDWKDGRYLAPASQSVTRRVDDTGNREVVGHLTVLGKFQIIVALWEATEPKAIKRGPYKKREARVVSPTDDKAKGSDRQ
jgi:hypothetical protein